MKRQKKQQRMLTELPYNMWQHRHKQLWTVITNNNKKQRLKQKIMLQPWANQVLSLQSKLKPPRLPQ